MGSAPYLKDLSVVRGVEWGRAYLWDCKFGSGREVSPSSIVPAPKKPFDTWFPATEVRENLATIQSKEFETHISTLKVPQSTSVFPIEITFIDDYKDTLSDWITDWINKKILGDGIFLYPLEEVVTALYIAKLKPDKSELHTSSYMVYPEGELYYEGKSENGLHTYQVTFISVGTIT
jgi:hypothetical protein